MARVKDWLIDMEGYTWEAIHKGLTLKQTIEYVKKNMKNIDESYIRHIYEEFGYGED